MRYFLLILVNQKCYIRICLTCSETSEGSDPWVWVVQGDGSLSSTIILNPNFILFWGRFPRGLTTRTSFITLTLQVMITFL